jgi:hypothetical protein
MRPLDMDNNDLPKVAIKVRWDNYHNSVKSVIDVKDNYPIEVVALNEDGNEENSLYLSIADTKHLINTLPKMVKEYEDAIEEINKFKIGDKVTVYSMNIEGIHPEGEIYDIDRVDKERPLIIKIRSNKIHSEMHVYAHYDDVLKNI